MKLTKSCKRWIDKNPKKIKVLEEEGLTKDEIGIVARFIGSISNDKRGVCDYCGKIYTVKEDKFSKRMKLKNGEGYCEERDRDYKEICRTVNDIIICIENP